MPSKDNQAVIRRLIGTCRLLSFNVETADGQVTYPFGREAAGYYILPRAVMRRWRYILQGAHTPLDKRKASGLDLVINDTWTGDSKPPVETLSGGEGFYTSLALAIGLAEVVQHYSGGIRLDTIFIDEGFGPLDADTLDLPIRTLEGLKENGRLVGIIPHVERLRERIPVRVEVISGNKGSSVKLVNA